VDAATGRSNLRAGLFTHLLFLSAPLLPTLPPAFKQDVSKIIKKVTAPVIKSLDDNQKCKLQFG
jgi:hypothetical protein